MFMAIFLFLLLCFIVVAARGGAANGINPCPPAPTLPQNCAAGTWTSAATVL